MLLYIFTKFLLAHKFLSTNIGFHWLGKGLDYEQSLIFLRDSGVGEHASARGNLAAARRVSSRWIFARDRVLSPEKNEGLLVV